MIKIRRILGATVVTGTRAELDLLQALSGIEISGGDKLTLLPAHHHVHRNPIRKPIIKLIEDQNKEEASKNGKQ